MRRLTRWAAAGTLLAAVATTPGLTAPAAPEEDPGRQRELRQQYDRRREGDLKVGDLAPEFNVQELKSKRNVKLSELRGKPVVLLFGSCT